MLLGDGGGDGEGGNTNLVLADSHDGLVLCGYWSVQQRKERGKCGGGKRKLAREKVRMCQQCAIFPENSSSHADEQRYLLLIVLSKGRFVNHQRRLHREVQFCG